MPATKKPARRSAAARTRVLPVRPLPVVMPYTAALVAVLQAHALGEHDMTATQVNVALSLLKIYAGHVQTDARPTSSHEDALAALG